MPLYLVLTVATVALAPVWLPLAALADAVTGRARVMPRTRALTFLAVYLLCETAAMPLCAVVWLRYVGGRVGGADGFLEANAALQRWFTGTLFSACLRVFAMRVEADGLDVARPAPFVLLVRHASTADTVLAAAFVANPSKTVLRYVLKRELLWDPALDVVGRRLRNAFVDRSGSRTGAEVAAIAGLAKNLDDRSGVLIYPEGTRYSPRKHADAVAKLRAKGRDDLAALAANFRSVLPPRPAGTLALLDAAPGVDVLVLEHAGFEGAATLPSLWGGALVGRTLRVRLRRIPAAEIPAAGREAWLFAQWAETDRWVTAARG